MNIGLIGYRNSGKSTIARMLGRNLSREVINSDKLIRDYFGMDIPEIIRQYGWRKFRIIEQGMLVQCLGKNDTVFDFGGGAVLHKNTIESLKLNSVFFYLDCSAETLLERAVENYSRPALTKLDLGSEIHTVLSARIPIYQRYADYIIDTENKTPEQCSEQIVEHLQIRNIQHTEVEQCVSTF